MVKRVRTRVSCLHVLVLVLVCILLLATEEVGMAQLVHLHVCSRKDPNTNACTATHGGTFCESDWSADRAERTHFVVAQACKIMQSVIECEGRTYG